MKKLILFGLLISAATLIGFWGSRRVCMMMMPSTFKASQNWYATLGLSAEQAQTLKKLESSYRADAERLCMQICKGRMELLKLVRAEEWNQTAVDQKIEELGALQNGLEKKVASQIREVKSRLTRDQRRTYLDRLREELETSIRQCGYAEVLRQT